MTERQGSSSKPSKSGSGSTAQVGSSRPLAKPASKPRATQLDRHDLYELAVQDPPSEVSFVGQTFKRLRGRPALSLREDFAGTSVFSLEWVRSHKQRTAIAVDLDRATLDWGLEHRIRPAGLESRIVQRCANVLDAQPPLVDVAVGFNFSYWCFDSRPALLEYFRAARAGLVADGMLVLDAYGGTEIPQHQVTRRETRDSKGVVNDGQAFTYIWDQIDYNPIDARMNCAIHFEFKDGSRIDRAFTYSWRVWTLPELSELLLEAGFAKVRVWAERESEDGEGTGRFFAAKTIDNEGVWWVYITAES